MPAPCRRSADDFDSVFGKAFARAYERSLDEVSAKERAMIRRRSLLADAAGPWPLRWPCCRCAPPPKPPPVLTLTMVGSADQNPDTAGQARAGRGAHLSSSTATAKFERGDVFALTEHEQQTLGQDDAGSQEFVLSPRRDADQDVRAEDRACRRSASSCCIATSTTRNGAPMRRSPTAGRPNWYSRRRQTCYHAEARGLKLGAGTAPAS